MVRRESYVTSLIDQIRRGATNNALLEQVEAREAQESADQEALRTAREIEAKVRNAIVVLPDVTKASIPDIIGRDESKAIVNATFTPDRPIHKARVNVYTSEEALQEARDQMSYRIDRTFTREEFNQWVLRNNIVYVDASQDSPDIQASFARQVAAIEEHQKARKPERPQVSQRGRRTR